MYKLIRIAMNDISRIFSIIARVDLVCSFRGYVKGLTTPWCKPHLIFPDRIKDKYFRTSFPFIEIEDGTHPVL